MYKHRRKVLSQNFIYNRTLIKQLVRRSSLTQFDTVLEIGPGKGFITSELLQTVSRVIAVELDAKLVLHLHSYLGNNSKLILHSGDFLNFHLPQIPYKVFANIPFSIEGKIVRKLLENKNPPQDCYLVVRKDLANRLSGMKGHNQFSIQYQPWFDFSIFYKFKKSDFVPNASMGCVMWRITKKQTPRLPVTEKQSYQKFIEQVFKDGRRVDYNLKRLFSREKTVKISQSINFSIKVNPSTLDLKQWIILYNLCHNIKDRLDQ